LSSIKENDQEKLEKALDNLKVYERAVWLTSTCALVIGIVAALRNSFTNPATIGPNIALALSAILYKCLISVAIVLPFTSIIKKKLDLTWKKNFLRI
jgi:flagellar motor component MotA